MSLITQYRRLQERGLELIEEIFVEASKAEDLALLLEEPKVDAGRYVRLGRSLFGGLPEPSEVELRTRTLELYRKENTPLQKLLVINGAVRKMHRNAAISREEMRWQLSQRADSMRVDSLKAWASEQIKAVNSDAAPSPERNRRYLRTALNADVDGMRHAIISLPDREMREFERALLPTVEKLRDADGSLSFEQARIDALVTLVRGNAAAPTGDAAKPLEAVVLVTTDDLDIAEHGDIDGSRVFHLTDGSTITAHDYLNRRLSRYGLCVLYDDHAEPVDLFRLGRLANTKQRQILAIDQLICTWPGCERPSYTCQPHHLEAWSHGGDTNLRNLAQLCSKHNGMNDDDPRLEPRNGRMERDPETGRIGRRAPGSTGPLEFNDHPVAAHSGGEWARSKLAGGKKS